MYLVRKEIKQSKDLFTSPDVEEAVYCTDTLFYVETNSPYHPAMGR